MLSIPRAREQVCGSEETTPVRLIEKSSESLMCSRFLSAEEKHLCEAVDRIWLHRAPADPMAQLEQNIYFQKKYHSKKSFHCHHCK